MPLPIFAEMSPGDWLAIGSSIAGGLVTAAGIIGATVKYAVGKWIDVRREDRKHETQVAAKFTETTKEIQDQAAADNRESFKVLVDIQKETIKAVAEVSGVVRELTSSVTELRHEMTGSRESREKRKRPRGTGQQTGPDGES